MQPIPGQRRSEVGADLTRIAHNPRLRGPNSNCIEAGPHIEAQSYTALLRSIMRIRESRSPIPSSPDAQRQPKQILADICEGCPLAGLTRLREAVSLRLLESHVPYLF